jgi:prenyltransferase beta subunit
MLIIYDNDGNIKFLTSDDNYVNSYLKKNNELPFIKYGTKSLWLKDQNFLDDFETYKVVNEVVVKRDEKEVNAILEKRKNNMVTKVVNINTLIPEVNNATKSE